LNYLFVKNNFIGLLAASMLTACSAQQDKSEQLTELTKKFDEMQQEQRLVLREVVSLQRKIDALAAQKAKSNNGSNLDGKAILLPEENRLQGSDDAQYAMVEFMDYQCPYCIRYAKQSLPTIKQRYVDTGKLKYGIRDFPLSFHSKAEGAAIAANCAGKQAKYWPMHDQLVANSKNLNDDLYMSLASKLSLEADSFTACLKNPAMKKEIQADLAYGTEIGTRGTPNFYIGKIEGDSIVNVVHLSGARSIDAFDRAIQQAMEIN